MATKLECTICLCFFSKPKILPCYHTFCESCLVDHASASSNSGVFQCPLCRKNTQIPKGGVKNFTNNFYINEQLTSGTAVDDNVIGAGHKPTNSTKIVICSRHGKDEDLFCEDCRLPMCSKCFVAKHNRHKVSDLQEVTTQTTKKIKSLFETFETKNQEYEEFESSVSAIKSSIDSHTEKLCNDIEKHANEVCKEITKISEKMRCEVRRQHSMKKAQLNELVSEVLKSKYPLKDTLDGVEGNLLAMLDLKSRLECRLKDSNPKPDFTVPNQRLMVFKNGTIQPNELSSQVGQIRFDKILETPKSRARQKNPQKGLTESFVYHFKLEPNSRVRFVSRDCMKQSPFSSSCFDVRGFSSFKKNYLNLEITLNRISLKLPLLMEMELMNIRDPRDSLHFPPTSIASPGGIHIWEKIIHRNTLHDGFLSRNDVFKIMVTLEEIAS